MTSPSTSLKSWKCRRGPHLSVEEKEDEEGSEEEGLEEEEEEEEMNLRSLITDLEEEDHLFYMAVHPEAADIYATQTTLQRLAEAHWKNTFMEQSIPGVVRSSLVRIKY